MISGLQLIEKEISNAISDELNKVGILYRIFSRAKDQKSIQEKIQRKSREGVPYNIDGKLMQDIIGVRVVTYFKDDIDIVYSILSKKLRYLDEEIDDHELTVFKPKRTNIICGFRDEHVSILEDVKKATGGNYQLVDNTFELQLRTMLSEGWHEIDHSLRYKCKVDWLGHAENERLLNGIYASLETNDIALKSLFNELSYKHYQNKNWEGLLRNKFRLQFHSVPIREDLLNILGSNDVLGKEIFKIPRDKVLIAISNIDLVLPMTFSNIIFLLNVLFLKNADIHNITPKYIRHEVE